MTFEERWWAWWEEHKNLMAVRDPARVDFVSMLNDELIALRAISEGRAVGLEQEIEARAVGLEQEIEALKTVVLDLQVRLNSVEQR